MYCHPWLGSLGKDIMNTFVQAPTTEKYWVECGPEFGSANIVNLAKVTKFFDGMKSSTRDFSNHLRDYMEHTLYLYCLTYPDLWMHKSKMHDGTDDYEYIILYLDNCLVQAWSEAEKE